MKFTYVAPLLAALSAGFVIPDEKVLAQLQPSGQHKDAAKHFLNKIPCPHHLLEDSRKAWSYGLDAVKNAFDHALENSEAVLHTQHDEFVPGFDAESWLEDAQLEGEEFDAFDSPEKPPHGPPHHGPPHHWKPPHHGPGKKPKHPGKHHGHKPNATIYELIAGSKYTTKLAKLIADDSELVDILNSTKANFTVFAPTDHAFSKIPESAPKPDKDFIKKVLLYHIAPGLYPAGRLLFSHTVPTLYNETLLGDKPQRLVAKLGLKGVSINFYSKVVAVNIPATNGLIHGVDSIIIPPPKTLKILSLLPSEFSTLLLGLGKTGLVETLEKATTVGGTFFAPPNGAFKKLGPGINAFLFSKHGEKYLKALLEYHVVANQTLYSNAYYGPSKSDIELKSDKRVGVDAGRYFHFDLPTLLEDKALAVDVTRFGPWITIKINGFGRVVVQDGIAKDGVLQVVNSVLIPPKKVGMAQTLEHWDGKEMSVEDLKERLSPFILDDAEEYKLDL